MYSARPTDAPKLGLYALKIGYLEVRRLSDSAKKYRVLATANFRDDLPQSHQRGVSDFQAAILLGEELALQDFSYLVGVFPLVGADTLQPKINALFSLCISVGALLYKGESYGESQIRNASRSATEARRVLSTLKSLPEADIFFQVFEDGIGRFYLWHKEDVDFSNVVSELDMVIADLAASSLDLQMLKIM